MHPSLNAIAALAVQWYRRLLRGKYSLLFGALVGCSHPAFGNDTILLPWTERRPYQYLDERGELQGILHQLGEAIFTKADIQRRWEDIPAKRIIAMLESGSPAFCLVGWFRTPERERIAKFTLPIYRDKPLRGVVRADASIADNSTLADLLSNPQYTILVKGGYSYGNVLDPMLEMRTAGAVERVVVDHGKLIKMLGARRADLLFLSQEEIDHYRGTEPEFSRNFRVLTFAELTEGNQRHIVCSRAVSDSTLRALDAAIKGGATQR